MKKFIWLGITIFGTVGGWLGGLLDHGNYLGGWSLLLGTLGSFAGIWIGYLVGKNYG